MYQFPLRNFALPHVNITVHNAHAKADESYSGVPLAELLAKLDAPLGEHLRGKALASYIVASGSDGYSVVLSIAEADPSFHGGEILVADTRDGQPLGKIRAVPVDRLRRQAPRPLGPQPRFDLVARRALTPWLHPIPTCLCFV